MLAARLLDLTRSLRRAGRMATGVDRVERAYLTQLVSDDVPLFALCRTAFGYVVLDRIGALAFLDRLEGRDPWPAADLLSRLPRNREDAVASAESSVRSDAVARCLPHQLPKLLAREIPDGFAYFNVGHSNLTERVLGAVKAAGGESHVLIHDVIPLEHPEYQRPGTVDRFRDKVQRVGRLADRIIYNSEDTRRRTETHLRGWGRIPPCIVSHLGTVVVVPDASELPKGLPPRVPYFVTVGTIEPRKNHQFLLDLWDKMGVDAPPLLICGSRGWNNENVFQKLDRLPTDHAVQEISGLSDPALMALIAGSAGMLFPTFAEGYGLPPIEALTLGSRVLCNDLPVFHEIVGDQPRFIPVSDSLSWLNQINEWEEEPSTAGKALGFAGPTWADHFKTVLRLR